MKVTLTLPLVLEKISLLGNRWLIREPFVFFVDSVRFEIPKGFDTDFASVPRIPFAYMIAGGRADISATVHDYLYSIQAGRHYADKVFRAAMESEGINWFVRSAMYRAVRTFGGKSYK